MNYEKQKQSGFKKFNDKFRELIDKHFPHKQSKERGAALILFAEMIVWIKKQLKLNK